MKEGSRSVDLDQVDLVLKLILSLALNFPDYLQEKADEMVSDFGLTGTQPNEQECIAALWWMGSH